MTGGKAPRKAFAKKKRHVPDAVKVKKKRRFKKGTRARMNAKKLVNQITYKTVISSAGFRRLIDAMIEKYDHTGTMCTSIQKTAVDDMQELVESVMHQILCTASLHMASKGRNGRKRLLPSDLLFAFFNHAKHTSMHSNVLTTVLEDAFKNVDKWELPPYVFIAADCSESIPEQSHTGEFKKE